MLLKSLFREMFGSIQINSKHYQTIALGELTEVGSSKRIYEKEYVESGIPFYRTKELVELSKSNSISTELYISKARYEEIRNKYGIPEKGDLLISAVGTIGIIWVVDTESPFYFKDGNILRVSRNNNFDSIFLKYVLDELFVKYKQQIASGTAYAALTIVLLSKFEIPCVPINFQHEYVSFVHKINKTKATLNAMLEKISLLKKAKFKEMFGNHVQYQTKCLMDIFKKVQSGEWGDEDTSNQGIPVLRTTNFTDIGVIDYTNVTTRLIDLKKVDKKCLRNGDILIEKSGGSTNKAVGRVVYFNSDNKQYLNNNFTAKLRLNVDYLLPRYVFSFLFFNYWSGGTIPFESKTTGIHNLQLNDYLSCTRIPIPPIHLQKQYISFVEHLDKTKATLERALEALS